MPHCPNCDAQIDIEPAYRANNLRGVFVPFLLLVPFIWYRDTTLAMRILIATLAVGPFLVTTIRFFPNLYQLKIPNPKREVRSDDGRS